VDLEALLRVMMFNRLCDVDSKLGVLRWLQTVSFPGIEGVEKVTHQQLLRTMNALIEHQALLENAQVEATQAFDRPSSLGGLLRHDDDP